MRTKTIASRVILELADQRRRIVSDWRIHLIARRFSHADNAPLPDETNAIAIRKELVRRGDIASVEGVPDVYVVNVAYASLLEVSEEQIVQEANPWAVFGFLTAMTHHGLTDLPAREVYAITIKHKKQTDIVSQNERAERLPLGTMPDDWADGIDLPCVRQPKRARGVAINWTQLTHERGFGVMVGYSFGVAIYVTDVERTLLDALRMPDKSGGIAKVLQAWQSADDISIDKIIAYTDNYNNQVLRQRVGFLLQKLGRHHPRLDEWRNELQRGGSIKLVASSPYSETHSVDWNLSLNVPPTILAILDGD